MGREGRGAHTNAHSVESLNRGAPREINRFSNFSNRFLGVWWAPSEACTERENLAGHRSEWLSGRPRNAKTSLGIAPNGLRGAPETRKPRWASLQMAFGASPKCENLAGHRSKWPSGRPRNAKTSLGIAPNSFRGVPRAPSRPEKKLLGAQAQKRSRIPIKRTAWSHSGAPSRGSTQNPSPPRRLGRGGGGGGGEGREGCAYQRSFRRKLKQGGPPRNK